MFRTDVKSYRSISLTSVFCKSMEKLLKIKIVDFLEKNNLILCHQSGARCDRFTLSQLILTQVLIKNDVSNRLCTDAIYTDLSKAFDSLFHTKLLHKLKTKGLDSWTFNWIRSLLLGRSQRVAINSANSSWLNCVTSVPQGRTCLWAFIVSYLHQWPTWGCHALKNFALC